MAKNKQYDILNMSYEELISAYLDTQRKLLELNLQKSREHINNYPALKQKYKKSIARLTHGLSLRLSTRNFMQNLGGENE